MLFFDIVFHDQREFATDALQVEFNGLTGLVRFQDGERSDVQLDVLKLRKKSLVKVGEWTAAGGVEINNNSQFYDTGPVNVTLKVVTIVVRHPIILNIVQ